MPNKPEASVITLAVPFGGAAEAGVGALGGDASSSPFVGEASVEMEALDSSSHRQLAAFIETRAAKKFNVARTSRPSTTRALHCSSTSSSVRGRRAPRSRSGGWRRIWQR
jgi:hypothetical protein